MKIRKEDQRRREGKQSKEEEKVNKLQEFI
jgi:hypothetical protein